MSEYKPLMTLMETEIAIKQTKDYFERALARELDLTRVSAPLFVIPNTGLNDNLNGYERPVSFDIKQIADHAEIVHSLAKWKRHALYRYEVECGKGIYTDMNAIRRDEDMDPLHSVYVDQWDWEKTMDKEDRNEGFLLDIVKKIYKALKDTESYLFELYPFLEETLPDEITFVSTQELEDLYPTATPLERENIITEKYGAVFIMKIGGALLSGDVHDGRAPDYDDWELNGDIVVYNHVLGRSFELSSMGIRVDEDSLKAQLEISGDTDREALPFHQMILNKQLPYSVGGGIGQSRMCMLFLKKAHIGEVQSSVWPEYMIKECAEEGIVLL